MKNAIFSLPNIVTYLRILFVPAFLYALLVPFENHRYIAVGIFLVLSFSDFVDGYIARKTKQITAIGKIADPIADKLLIVSALLALLDSIPVWVVLLIIVREVGLTLLRFILIKKEVHAADSWGKIKTTLQIVGIVAVILELPFALWILYAALAVTLYSGYNYLKALEKHWKEPLHTLANAITTIRLLLIPVFVELVLANQSLPALITLILIVASDKLDGFFARTNRQSSRFGRLYDAFIDLTALSCGYIVFFATGIISLQWFVAFAVATIIASVLKTIAGARFEETTSPLPGKIAVGLAYISLLLAAVDSPYLVYSLATVLIAAFSYFLYDIARLIKA